MKYLKYLLVVFATIFIFGCSSSSSSKGSGMNTGNKDVVYATDIGFEDQIIFVNVGDKLDMSTLKVNVLPSDSKIQYFIELTPTTKASVENNIVTFLEVGEVEFVARVLTDKNVYKTASLICEIKTAPVFATNAAFQYKSITLDISETATNRLIISPETYNQGVVVSYLNNNIVAEYDYITGKITPVKVGTGTVNIQLKSAQNKTIISSFDICVTNNVLAQEIGNIRLNNITVGDEVDLFVGDYGTLTCDILPNGFNMDTYIETSNKLITFDGYNFVVGNTEGVCNINIYAQSNSGYLKKTLKVNVLRQPANLEFKLEHIDDDLTDYYSNLEYLLTITTVLDDYSNITFDNCQYTYISDNKYKIKFSKAGNVKLRASTTFSGLLSNKQLFGENTFRVFNPVTDVNFSLTNNDEIIPVNDIYTIYLPDTKYIAEAIEANELVYADINLSAKGLYINPTVLNFSVEGDSVVLQNNRIVANKLGQSKIVVTCSDGGGFTKEYLINVKPLLARNIVVENDIQLYLNGVDETLSFTTITPVVEPIYAYDSTVEISTLSANISVNENQIMALSGGNATVKLTCGSVEKTINIIVNYVPTHLLVKLNNETVTDGDMYICELGDIHNIVTALYSNDVALVGYNIDVSLNNQPLAIDTISRLCFNNPGEYNIKVKYMDLSISFTITARLTNQITSFKFKNNDVIVNIFNANECEIEMNYDVVVQYPDESVSDELTFASSNTQVAVIDGNMVSVIGQGEASIIAYINGVKVDEFKINAYSKEVLKIASLSDFYNIDSNKTYIVTSNIDFSTFSMENSKDFAGEIDFNNKSISNLKYPLFNVLADSAKIYNLKLSGKVEIDVNDTIFDTEAGMSLVAIQNNGLIENLTFDNVDLTISNKQSLSKYLSVNLVSYINNGTITNLSYLNTSITITDTTSTSVNAYKVSGALCDNFGTLSNVEGNITFTGFTKVSGLVINHYNLLENVDLNIDFMCTQENKIQIGGLVYKSSTYNEVNPKINNVDLTINTSNLSSSDSINFGGLIYTNNVIEGENITINHTFNGEFNDTKTHLMFYTSSSNLLTDVEVNSNIDFDM